MSKTNRPVFTIDQARRAEIRMRRRRAIEAGHDVLADRLVGIRQGNPFAYATGFAALGSGAAR